MDRIELSLTVDGNYNKLMLGFLESNNPYAFKRLLNVASLNAARTMVGPMRAEAPVGNTTKTPGRLRKSVTARRARFGTPAAVVGPRAGRNRVGASGGAWYRWFVTSGISGVRQTKNGPKAVKPVRGNPFVMRIAQNQTYLARAVEAYAATAEAYFNNEKFRNTILKFKRGK
jgi:hypothetical protein